jgi:MtN3 and saliva related transmembrane protein
MPLASHHVFVTHKRKHQRKSFIDKFIYVVAITAPLATLPQLIIIFSSHNAQGVSISSWTLYTIFAAVWLWYGVHIKKKPMVVAQALFLLTDLAVVIGAFLYGGSI